ncbi:unnamed protein product [Diabrotica balteata]|uniref:Uncharacterized protein n=1 Tax=Diabrotica balteata TaxID=107213 RepID=A0A9N9T7W3_DIABA|nr:unnamed protein product [Diabrotica balteata]
MTSRVAKMVELALMQRKTDSTITDHQKEMSTSTSEVILSTESISSNVKHAPEGDSRTGWKPAFPVNVTVDELYLYRKKKHNFDWLKDNIQIEEGSFKNLKSEYRRRFKNFYEILKSLNENEKDLLDVEPTKQEVLLNLAGAVERKSEYNESFNRNLLQRPSDTYGIMNEVSDNQTSNRYYIEKEF